MTAPSRWRLLPAGERAFLVEPVDPARVLALAASITAAFEPDSLEVVPGAATVLVRCRSRQGRARVLGAMERGLPESPAAPPGREVTLPVCYDGADLAEVAHLLSLPVEEVVARHAARRWHAAFLGFSPGFAYLTADTAPPRQQPGGPADLSVPRRAVPRPAVPAGSVALAAGMTAVYPQATPGGWRIIGTTGARLFDPQRSPPALISPGDTVRFTAVGHVDPPAPLQPAELPAVAGARYVRVVRAGPLSTIQDPGRPGWGRLGVPLAGWLDAGAATAANRAVGNRPDAAVLECSMGGPSLVVGAPATISVTGARVELTVDGLPARAARPLRLPAGAELVVGRYLAGARCYIAFAGGIDVPPVLGSRSADTLGRLGPRPLRDGDVLAIGPPPPGRPPIAPSPAAHERHGGEPGDALVIDVGPGPRLDWFGPDGLERLASGTYAVGTLTDRTGVRLTGPPLEPAVRRELPSEGMVAGAVQVPPSGQPIVLMSNHPTTGGYPVVGVVTEAGIDQLAQARPGDRVRFRPVG